MKKSFIICLISVYCLLAFTGCKKSSGQEENTGKNCEIALVTDYGSVEDGAYNQQAWQGIKKYSEEKGLSAEYFVPSDLTTEAYLVEIKNAVKSGAKVIVCPGTLMEEAVYDAQKQYKDVNFILVDGEPHNKDFTDVKTAENTESIKFSEEEAGFLAGYASVREGYTYLGFIGGMPDESVVRYGYGFVQGADYAAIEMGIKIYCAYVYGDTFSEDVNVKNMAGNWYENGVEAILACGDSMNKSVIKAAEEHGTFCMTSDYNEGYVSPNILFSCFYNIEDAVYDAVASYYSNTFLGGSVKRLSITEDGVGIKMDKSHFSKFSEVEYDAIYNLLKSNEIKPYSATDLSTTDELNLVNTNIVYAEY